METETLKSGVTQDEISKNHTYLETMNYWAPLDNDNNE